MALPHHPPLKHKRTTLERAEKFISDHCFTDVNLTSKLYSEKLPVKCIKHHAASGRIPYDKAIKENFNPVALGQSFGPVWSTHWFEIEIEIPESWAWKEVHFLWNSGSEALVWINGEPRQGLNEMKEKHHYIFAEQVNPQNLKFKIYVEMACNSLFGISGIASHRKDDEKKKYTLAQAEIGLYNREAFDLIQDIESLHDIAKEFGEEQRGYQALYAVNTVMNILATRDDTQWSKCRDIAKTFFAQKNGESQHILYAMGHGHIDSAWLWPYDETIRKCARSWSCTIRLMEKHPEFKFCCSQAQQYEWVKQHYPSLWSDICKFVVNGQFIPVGGAWVEMDGNLPSGEACIRQFLLGQRFFLKEFGKRCKEFWLPDTFGYSAQFPQILRHCGITRFLSQKLSWSLVNKFPHHTFQWEGIDGSQVLAHFPPGDSYEMNGTVKELRKSVNNFNDKGRSNCSAFLFGHGDGGHGPSEEMLGRLFRFKDCDGLPKVKLSGPDEFFSVVEKEDLNMLCRWRGELYLELHNGTYTTWGKVKKSNRQCEILLQEIEAVSTYACFIKSTFSYPYNELNRLWKLLLLNQFHDVLPGSSISQVFEDAMNMYNDILQSGKELLKEAVDASMSCEDDDQQLSLGIANFQGFERSAVVELLSKSDCNLTPMQSIAQPSNPFSFGSPVTKKRKTNDEKRFAKLKVPSLSIKHVKESKDHCADNVLLSQSGKNFMIQNGCIKALIDPLGRVISLKCISKGNSEVLSKEVVDQLNRANQFILYDDIPLYWDAWDVMDYHLETRQPLVDVVETVEVSENDPLRKSLKFKLRISEESYINQKITLDSGSPYLRFDTEVMWKESHKFLKVEFPTTIRALSVTYDIQSGFYSRPNHFNTSWDSARFEVCGHKWADISEHGFGVSILNDCKYGYSAVDGILRLSLLRSPKGPDPNADMGSHTFAYAMMPHFGSFQEAGVIQESISFNAPLKLYHIPENKGTYLSLFTINTPQVLIQTVKMAEDQSNDVILRLNEAFGGCVDIEINSSVNFSHIQFCNGLEERITEKGLSLHEFVDNNNRKKVKITLSMKPFQIISLRCSI